MGNLWITYAWADNTEGDFDYLVRALQEIDVKSIYDRVALIPGQKLWEQIGDQICKGELSGWAYLVTPNSVSSKACSEELAYALDRAISNKDSDFPIIGLLHGVDMENVPHPLRVRLCVNLLSPTWKKEIKAALEKRPPQIPLPANQSEFRLKVHRTYLGQTDVTALEIGPRFGERRYWRFGFPTNGPMPIQYGAGPANGGGIGSSTRDHVEGYVDINGNRFKFIGSGDPLSSSTSAYLAFRGPVPRNLIFGVAKEPFGHPDLWWPLGVS